VADVKKRTKIILTIVLSLWFLLFAADIIAAFVLKHPLFCIETPGGCYTIYFGLGYAIEYRYSAPRLGEVFDPGPPYIFPWIYLLVNIGILVHVIKLKKRSK
jgi:hypothetical protein